MDRIRFKINGKEYSVGSDVDSHMTLLEFLRNRANLRGTKYMCLEAGCGACIVSVVKSGACTPEVVNSCMVAILSCRNWEITTIEKLGNRLDGYHPIQKVLARHNGTQCGYCSPGWVMSMYSLLESKPDITMLEVEKSFSSNVCRCTGYRPILEAFKTFAEDAPKDINDIEDVNLCKKNRARCNKKCGYDDWCVVSHYDVKESDVQEIVLEDGKLWYRANTTNDVFDILKSKGDDSYMLVAGNTAKGAYPIEGYPKVLIDISEIPELKGYVIDQNLVIGAGTTLSELLTILSTVSQQEYFEYLKILGTHIESVAHTAVRNLGTIGGNLMIKHQHNQFPSDIFMLLETIGAQITILFNPLVKRVYDMKQFLNINMRGKIILNILLPPFGDEWKLVTYKSAINILETEIVVDDFPGEPSVAYRKQLALALFFKGLLSLCPVSIVDPRYRSGMKKLHETRPVSKARQLYDTNPSQYPLTQPIPKIEALLQCAGEASYTEDRAIYPHEVYGALVLSTVPTGNIVSIDPSLALKQPGAIAFYSAKDIPGLNSFTPAEDPFSKTNEEVFSSGEIKYFNQPLGVIVAEKNHIAYKISKMIVVEYENIKKPVIDVKEAQNDTKRVSLLKKFDATDKGENIKEVVKGNITLRGQSHFTMETIVCITVPNEEGLEVHTTTQNTDAVQIMIARALNIQQNRIDVHVRRLGGGFGLKISRNTLPAVACSLVSYKLNRSCRIIMPLTSNTRAFGKRFPASSDYEVAVDNKGLIQYLNLSTYEDHGFVVNETLNVLAVNNYYNCYNPSRWNYKNFDTLTDTAKNSWFRAPGHLEAVATVETIIDHLSYALSLDPLEVRLINLDESVVKDIVPMVDNMKTYAQYNVRKEAKDKFNTENRWKKRGLRFSLLKWPHKYPRYFDVNLSVFHGDGTIIITHGGVEMGQGINTKAAQTCSYLLKVPLEKIQIKSNNTTIASNAAVTGGSLTTQNIIIGVHKCCLELIKRLKPIRDQMENSNWDKIIEKGYASNVDLQVHGFVGQESELKYNISGAALVEVEVDILTGEREILRVDIIQDVGQSISPEIDIGQVEGAFIMGIGYWLSERLEYNHETGELLTDRTWNYYVPQARDIPQDFRVYFKKNSYSDPIIFNSKAVGEPPLCLSIAVPLAVREAVCSARLDSGIPASSFFENDGPFTTEKVCLAAKTNPSDFRYN